MLSIVIPTWQAADLLGRTLESLTPAPPDTEFVLVDGGSTDTTRSIASLAGCTVVSSPRGRGTQLAAGALAANGEWLMFLHADTIPADGWADEVANFTADPKNRGRAAVFRFALDDSALSARLVEWLVAWRCRLFALPYGDQGLVIHRDTYHSIGGFRPMAMFEDVDLVRRLGRRRLKILRAPAVTSAERFRHDGYLLRPLRNFACLTLYLLGLSPRTILRLYR